MADPQREVWITGIGIVSTLGEGPDAHWQALTAGARKPLSEAFAPYAVHPLAPVNFDTQIPKKGDQRQMEAWQRIGTYAAGLALDRVGLRRQEALLHGVAVRQPRREVERVGTDLAVHVAKARGQEQPPAVAGVGADHDGFGFEGFEGVVVLVGVGDEDGEVALEERADGDEGQFESPLVHAEGGGRGGGCEDRASQRRREQRRSRRAHLAEGTVRNYLSSAQAKLQAANRHEAAAIARRQGWI